MSWLDNVLSKPIDQAKVAAEDAIQKLDPVVHTAEMRLAGILDTLVTRLGGTKVHITFEIPKAGEDWEKTPP